MESKSADAVSRHLSYLLRHSPQTVSEQGWASFNTITAELSQKAHRHVSEQELRDIVATDSKGRYQIDGYRIRAVQGHSHEVQLDLEITVPPVTLFHGTVEKFVDSIRADGLQPQSRTFVHLSESESVAAEVAARREGKKFIFAISALEASEQGVDFYRSINGVWLARSIPTRFLSLPQ